MVVLFIKIMRAYRLVMWAFITGWYYISAHAEES